MMRTIIYILFGLTFSLIGFTVTPTFGQCIRFGSFKVNSVAGQAFYVSKDRKHIETLAEVSLRLLKTTDQGQEVIAEQKTDASGAFSFTNVKPGKYGLEASMEMMDTIFVGIKVVKNKSKRKDSFFIVELGVTDYSGTDSCEGDLRVEWR